jgi:thiosulfate/3-mercaptopyruvate sulfurtransferase
MLPTAEDFAHKVGLLGISNSDRVIVYDRHDGGSAAARVWWMFRVFGHDNVALLDGGLPKWKAEGRALQTAAPDIPERQFRARFDADLVRSKAAVVANVRSRWEQIVDARSPGRFDGTAEETWPGRRRGHIPSSRNLPFDQVTDPKTKQLKDARELRALFADAGVALDRPIIASCGSGVTACALAFAAYLIGHERVAVYDGSWSEWGLPDGPPIETGPVS